MTKLKFYLLGFVAIALSLMACSNDQDIDEISKGSIAISFSNSNQFKSALQEDVELIPESVYITIKDSELNTIYNLHELPLIKIGDGYITKQIALDVDNYTIEDFIVVDKTETVIYLTPKTGSSLEELVETPLPVDFEVTADSTASINIEVIAYNLGNTEDFGYSEFSFKIVNPIEDGLVAYYPFNGNLEDSCKNELDAVDYGIAFTEDIFGNSESAIYFDAQSYIVVPHCDELNFGIEDFSVSLWINTEDTSCQMLLQKGGLNQQYDPQYWLRLNDQYGEITFLTGNGVPPSVMSSSNTGDLSTNSWHHIVSLRDGETLRIYLDGKLVSETSEPQKNTDVGDDLKFGIQITHGAIYSKFIGSMDEIRFYNKALNAVEVDLLHKLK